MEDQQQQLLSQKEQSMMSGIQQQSQIAWQPQEVEPNKKFDYLMQQMQDYNSKIPPVLVQKILEEVGFESSDEETYKMIGMLTDKFLDELVNQIHQSRYVQVDKRSKKDKKNTRDEYSKFLTFDLVNQLKQSGVNIAEPYAHPQHSAVKKDDK